MESNSLTFFFFFFLFFFNDLPNWFDETNNKDCKKDFFSGIEQVQIQMHTSDAYLHWFLNFK